MMQFGLVGIGAGAAAALLFASVTSGSFLSVFLFYLAPLPVMIAGLGWSHWAAMVAALTGSLAVGAIFGGVFFFAFIAGIGVPAWWLTYLSALARPVPAGAEGGQASLEWYPPGRLVLWAAALGALVVIVAIPKFGWDAESFRSGLTAALSRMIRAEGPAGETGVPSTSRLIELLVTVVPVAAGVIATVTNVVNLWLAGRVVKFSNRLAHPWPDVPAMSFPPLSAAALGAAVALSFTGGIVAVAASIVAASLTVAYGVLGFAVLHTVTRGQASRPFLLGGIYASVIVFGWPVLMLALLGLVETFFGVRSRITARRGRPTV